MNINHHAVVISLAVLLLAPTLGGQSESQTFPNELTVAARKNALLQDSDDLSQLARSVQNQLTELTILNQLNDKAGQGLSHVDAAYWFVALYDHMQCEPDRYVAKQVLVNRLDFYSHLLGILADQAAGSVGNTRLPATANAGTKVKDDLRAARTKLDEISATLK